MDDDAPGHRFVVRPATPEDADALGAVHVRSWQRGYAGILPAHYLADMSVEQRQQWWARVLADPKAGSERPDAPPSIMLVAESSHGITGFAIVGASRDEDAGPLTGELYAMYVDPPAWSTGCGRALHEHAMAGLRSRGYTSAVLWVFENNARARRFYELAGWHPDGAADDYTRPEFTRREVRYAREIPA